MIGVAWRQLRTRTFRSAALVCAVLIAAVGFMLLTAATDQARLVVHTFVDANSRGAYDLLVRPTGVRSTYEHEHGLVRPAHLDGQGGTLTVEQWKAVQRTAGVEIAAPAGVLGYVGMALHTPVDVTDAVDMGLENQVIRLWPTLVADGGLSRLPDVEPRFAYVTTRPIAVPSYINDGGQEGYVGPDGILIPQSDLLAMGCADVQVPYVYLEQATSGRWSPICGTQFLGTSGNSSGTAEMNSATFSIFQLLPDGTFIDFTGVSEAPDPLTGATTEPQQTARVNILIETPLWLPVGVIDPAEENRLVSVDEALLRGQPLPRHTLDGGDKESVPVLIASDVAIDEQLDASIERIRAVAVAAQPPPQLLKSLSSAPPDITASSQHDLGDVYRRVISTAGFEPRLDLNVAVGRVRLSGVGGDQLRAEVVEFDRSAAWRTSVSLHGETGVGRRALQPQYADDVAFREVQRGPFLPPSDVLKPSIAHPVGMFDPARIRGFSEFAAVPLGLYESGVRATLSDGRTAELRPNTSPTGYLALQPSLLVSVASAQQLTGRNDVFGAVRVRVVGVTGIDPVSRERVRQVAEEIARIPGVEVDITLGSSPVVQPVQLPQGGFGRPAAVLKEMWPRKGVAAEIINAASRKDLLLFGLVLTASLCFLGNAASAAVRGRRSELALLACLGWSRTRIVRLLLTEAALLGMGAGLLAVPIGYVLAWSINVEASWWRAAVTVPAAVLVTMLAALSPALRAARLHPLSAVQPPVAHVRRAYRATTRTRMAISYVLRTPGRSLAATAAVAVAAGTAAILISIVVAFNGSVVGSLLGDAVSIQVRGVDLLLVGVLAVLGVASIADVVYVGLRERGAELKLLRAVGWSRAAVAQIATIEANLVGATGAAIGVISALGAVYALIGSVTPTVIAAAMTVGVTMWLLAILAGLLTAHAERNLSGSALHDNG